MSDILIRPVPPEWRRGENAGIWKVLELLQKAGANPVIFGGCLRDLALGERPKDIDVFVHADEATVKRALRTEKTPGWQKYYPDTEGQLISEVLRDRGIGTIVWFQHLIVPDITFPVDVLWSDEPLAPEQAARSADFGICQIATDGANLFFTKGFEADMSTLRIVLRHEGTHRYREWLRAIHLGEKFPRLRIRYRSLLFPEVCA